MSGWGWAQLVVGLILIDIALILLALQVIPAADFQSRDFLYLGYIIISVDLTVANLFEGVAGRRNAKRRQDKLGIFAVNLQTPVVDRLLELTDVIQTIRSAIYTAKTDQDRIDVAKDMQQNKVMTVLGRLHSDIRSCKRTHPYLVASMLSALEAPEDEIYKAFNNLMPPVVNDTEKVKSLENIQDAIEKVAADLKHLMAIHVSNID